MSTVEKIIEKLNMSPHPEGGYNSETFRSDIEIPCNFISNNNNIRNASTGIYIIIIIIIIIIFFMTSNLFSHNSW